jgi:hypothetical protein
MVFLIVEYMVSATVNTTSLEVDSDSDDGDGDGGRDILSIFVHTQ